METEDNVVHQGHVSDSVLALTWAERKDRPITDRGREGALVNLIAVMEYEIQMRRLEVTCL